ncbi:hypothetical protein [Morganella morganii IS15]|nr:hypothetical protein [Morganella morganii IS15]
MFDGKPGGNQAFSISAWQPLSSGLTDSRLISCFASSVTGQCMVFPLYQAGRLKNC